MVKEIRFCKFKRLVVWTKGKFGTGEGLLGYGICARCKKQAPGVRGAFSEALRAQNRLLWYGRDIRYRKRPPMVRVTSSVRRLFGIAACGTIKRGISLWIVSQADFMHNISLSHSLKNSVPERASWGTEYARGAKNRLLRYATHFLKPSVLKTGFCGTEGIFGTGNALLRYGMHFQSA